MGYTLINAIYFTQAYLIRNVLLSKNFFDDYTRIKRTHLWRMNVDGGYWELKDAPLELQSCIESDKAFQLGDWLWYYGTNFLEFQFVFWNVVEVTDYYYAEIPIEIVANIHLGSMIVTASCMLYKAVSIGILGL